MDAALGLIDNLKVERSINYIVFPSDATITGSGLNTVTQHEDGYEVIRCHDILPIDNIDFIVSGLQDFNEHNIPQNIERRDPYLSWISSNTANDDGQEQCASDGDVCPVSHLNKTNDVSVRTKSGEDLGDSIGSTFTSEAAIANAQLKCTETMELVEMTKRELIPSHNETKYQSQYIQEMVKNKRFV